MATKLTKPVVRETDLKIDGKSVIATMSPEDNGCLVLKLKGAKKGGWSIRFSDILKKVSKAPDSKPVDEKKKIAKTGDIVDLGELEMQLMIAEIELETKNTLFGIIRDMRNEKRNSAGMKKVGWEEWERQVES